MDLITFQHIARQYAKPIYRLALSLLRNQADAEDAVQETMLKLWQHRNTWQASDSQEAFAIRIAKNHCLDQLRRQQTRKVVGIAESEFFIQSREASPYQQVEEADHVKQITSAIEVLPENQRTVFHLRNVEGYSFQEIEQVTGFTVNHTRVLLSRARKHVNAFFMHLEKQDEKRKN